MIIMFIIGILCLGGLLVYLFATLIGPVLIGFFTIVGVIYMFSTPNHGAWRYDEDMRIAKNFEREMKAQKRRDKRYNKEMRKQQKKKGERP